MKNSKKYNSCIDVVKGIACICVVFMHCEFPGKLGIIVQCLSRFSVPFFFMVSGYYCFYGFEKKENRILRKIRHIAKMTGMACLFYGAVAACFHLVRWGGYSLSVSLRGLFSFIIFNQPFIVAGQLWFMFALLYIYILYYIIERFGFVSVAYKTIPVLFAAYIIMAQGFHFIGHDIPNLYYRNWLIEGFPFFMSGHYIHANQEKIRLDNPFLLGILIVSTGFCLIERYICGRDFGVNICTLPQVMSLFLLAVNNSEFDISVLGKIGQKHSMLIYLLHPFIWHCLENIYVVIGVHENVVALYLMPIAVVVLTLVLSGWLNKIMKFCETVRRRESDYD